MKALTAAEMREVDRLSSARFGIPSRQLMEEAGRNVAELVRELAPALPARVTVLCGKGNNGGDGLVAARYLKSAGYEARVLLFGRAGEMRGDAAENLARWREGGEGVTEIQDAGGWEAAWGETAGAEVIVDALLGTGLRGAAEGAMAQAIADVNRFTGKGTSARPRLILAVDMPSGLPSDGGAAEGEVLQAHATVTFTAAKVGQLVSRDAAAVGALRVRQIGTPLALVEEIGKGRVRWIEPGEFAGMRLVRAAGAHKGDFGHVLLVCGSVGKSGAAVLAGKGALRAGAGLVTVAVPGAVRAEVAAGQPEYMTEGLDTTEEGTVDLSSFGYGRMARILAGKSVMGLGPGLGTNASTQQFIREVAGGAEIAVILDADGLNAFAGQGEKLGGNRKGPLTVTPHPGEMARLLGSKSARVQADRLGTAAEAARRWNACVVLKGFHTVVAGPEGNVFVNTSGNAGLAKGGSGDVLTGVLAGLEAQWPGEDRVRLAALGVYLHGAAAELAVQRGDCSGLLAGEVAEAIPAARRELLGELQKRG